MSKFGVPSGCVASDQAFRFSVKIAQLDKTKGSKFCVTGVNDILYNIGYVIKYI
jgi:hypothetical protein